MLSRLNILRKDFCLADLMAGQVGFAQYARMMQADHPPSPEIATRMKAARLRAGYTQEQAAELIGVSRTSVTMWERKARPVLPETARLAKIEQVYGVSMSYILHGANDEHAEPVAREHVATYNARNDMSRSLREMADDLAYMWMSLPDDDRRKIYDQTALAFGLHHVSRRRNKPVGAAISHLDDGGD